MPIENLRTPLSHNTFLGEDPLGGGGGEGGRGASCATSLAASACAAAGGERGAGEFPSRPPHRHRRGGKGRGWGGRPQRMHRPTPRAHWAGDGYGAWHYHEGGAVSKAKAQVRPTGEGQGPSPPDGGGGQTWPIVCGAAALRHTVQQSIWQRCSVCTKIGKFGSKVRTEASFHPREKHSISLHFLQLSSCDVPYVFDTILPVLPQL